MKTKIVLAIVALFLTLSGLLAQPLYEWRPSNTGGGGYITGIVQDQKNLAIIYARCDVGGVFRTDNGGKQWVASNSGLKRWYNHSVQSIAIDPGNSNILFRCSGDIRNQQLFGSIHKSVDAGKTWREVSTSPGYYGNGPTRMYGELIAIDPFDSGTVVTAGYGGGIWISHNGGDTWQYSAGKEETFISIAIHPWLRNRYYAAAANGKIYFSENKGKSWTARQSLKEGEAVTEFAFDKKNTRIVHAAATDGVYKSIDGGKTFKRSMAGLPDGFQYNTIASSAEKPEILYTAPDARPGHKLAPIPVYKSTNGGQSWQLVKSHTRADVSQYPAYIREMEFIGWAISKIRVSDAGGNNIMFSNWYGVSFSADGGVSYNGKDFSGLETNCLEHIQYVAGAPEKVFYTVADHRPMVSSDKGRNYTPIKGLSYPSSTALVRSARDPDLIIYGARSKGKAGILRQVKDSIALVLSLGDGFVQALREDPFTSGKFYAYIDGELKDEAGLYISLDNGITWSRQPDVFPSRFTTLPVNRSYIENELLNIVVGQVKNVCGANQLLCVDPVQPGYLYLGEWTEGMYRTIDGGKKWESISSGLPFHRDTASVLTVIKADPKRKGWIYAGFIREGLWRSTNSGASWEKIYPTDNTIFNVSSMHVGGTTGEELYIAGENLYWSDAPVSVMYSPDQGRQWNSILGDQLGAIRIKSIDVDPATGTIFLASSGNGAFYAIRK